jgi:hypothetical protein
MFLEKSFPSTVTPLLDGDFVMKVRDCKGSRVKRNIVVSAAG